MQPPGFVEASEGHFVASFRVAGAPGLMWDSWDVMAVGQGAGVGAPGFAVLAISDRMLGKAMLVAIGLGTE